MGATVSWCICRLTTLEVVSGAAALAALPEDLRQLALHSSVTYAPHPYIYIAGAKCHSTGLVCHSDGLEKPVDQLPPWQADQCYTVPMVWTNPATGVKSLQLHGACVWKLHLRSSAADTPRIVEDLAEVREIVYRYAILPISCHMGLQARLQPDATRHRSGARLLPRLARWRSCHFR